MEHEKKVVLLAGPTASGKSKLAMKLAQNLNGEIINADSMQIYKEISVLTSKPNLKAGKHTFIWTAKDLEGNLLPSGLYFIVLNADKRVNISKVAFIK